jgi:hypothetical protein
MTDTPESGRRPRTVVILLSLLVLVQAGILNEIRYQGCASNHYRLLVAQIDKPGAAALGSIGCSRVPLV